MSSEDVTQDETEEATEPVANDDIEEVPKEQTNEVIEEVPKETNNEQLQEVAPKAKAKAKAKARTVKVVELVECEACNKKMLPKSLRNTRPYYCKGQPTEALPVNRQKASYGSKVEQKLRKEIEEEMKAKYTKQEQPKVNEVVQYSQPIEVKTKAKPVRMEEAPHEVSRKISEPPPRQLTARELLEASYNEIRKAKREEHIQKINSFKSKMF